MADNKRPFSRTVLAGDGLLLLCALWGFTGSFLSLYGDPDAVRLVTSAAWLQATALDRCAANGDMLLFCAVLFGLAALTAWSLPRRWGAAAGGLTALWAGAVLWNRAEVTHGLGVTVREITALFAGRVAWGRAFSYETDLLPAEEADAAQLFLLLMLAGLALLLGWAVVRSRRWWAAMLLTLPPLLPGLLADLYPDWIPFMALAACWCAMLLTSLCRWAAPDGRGRLTLAVLSAAALVLALVTALFPREGYTRPDWARKAQNDLLNLTSRLSDYLPRWDSSPFKTTVTYVGAAEEADLAHAGPLDYTGRIVLRVTSDYDGRLYLRGSSLAVYEDGVWKALPDGTYEEYWSGQEPEVSPLYLPAMQNQAGSQVYTVTVDNVGAVGSCVYAPYYTLPQDANESGMLPVEDAYFARREGQWSHTMTFVQPSLLISAGVTVKSSADDGGAYDDVPEDLREALQEALESAASDYFVYDVDEPQYAAPDYAEYVYENYLDVPEDLRDVLTSHTMRAAYPYGYIHPAMMAQSYALYLQTLCEYDAAAPAAPAGVDPVRYFLDGSHRGYCMHYASAVTLMLRAAGFPARYVSGFSTEVVPNQQMRVPDRAAHAWVEVWVDGFGWYPVEVTPADAFDWASQPDAQNTEPIEDTPQPTPARTERPEPTETPDQPTPTPTVSGGDLDRPEQDRSGPDFSALLNVLKGIAPVIATVFLVWFVQFAVKRFRARRMSGADANRSALVCYGYLCRLERLGGRIDPRAVELAQKARFSQHTLTGEELDVLRCLVDRERARLCEASGPITRLVWRYWWGMPKPPVPPADDTPPKREE